MKPVPAARILPPLAGGSSLDVLNERIGALHREVRAYFPFVSRLAVALYDPATDEIKTFLHSPTDYTPISHYATRLSEATWLDALRRERRSRVIEDFARTDLGAHAHSLAVRASPYRSSYTVPIFEDEEFLGFVFFNADTPNVFRPRVTRQLDLFVRIVSLMVETTIKTALVLVGSVHLLREISRFRDDETASHLSRMSYFSQLVARRLADEGHHDDEWVEHVRLFAPLHDVGKVATPDAILLKAGALSEPEFEVMKQHAPLGAQILLDLVREMRLEAVPHIASMLGIARHHHERWDGGGYPDGLAGESIPLEARIVTVADVFDALTSERCYKPAWPVERAAAYLRDGRGVLFDPRCVDAFLEELPAARAIMARFAEASTEAV